MKNGWREVIGRTIEGVIVGESKRTPRHQVFLLFSDGTSFEIYGDAVPCARGVDVHPNPERAIHPREGKVVAVYWEGKGPRPRPPLETGRDLIAYGGSDGHTREVSTAEALRAWREAKAAIDAARRG